MSGRHTGDSSYSLRSTSRILLKVLSNEILNDTEYLRRQLLSSEVAKTVERVMNVEDGEDEGVVLVREVLVVDEVVLGPRGNHRKFVGSDSDFTSFVKTRKKLLKT